MVWAIGRKAYRASLPSFSFLDQSQHHGHVWSSNHHLLY